MKMSFSICLTKENDIKQDLSLPGVFGYSAMRRAVFCHRTTPTLLQTFNKWKPEQQEHFLDFCTGAKGVKVLYDGFFKEVMDPDITPHRLEKFLSLLLEQEITIVSVLANDSTRIADESSILITDIVVRLSDGSLANVEVQKSVIFSRANGAPATPPTCSCGNIKK